MHTQTVLIVDDEKMNRNAVKRAMSGLGVEILQAASGQEALAILEETSVELILLDVIMKGMTGFEVLKVLNKRGALENTSVILLTALQDSQQKLKGFELGAVDYIVKPFLRGELLARVKLHLSLRMYQTKISRHADNLERLVGERTKQLRDTQDVVAFSLARLTESRDPETGAHLERMSRYSEALAEQLARGAMAEAIPEGFPWLLRKVAVLHDIGKVGIPDSILLKPGKLTTEEFEVMKEHTIIGGDTLLDANGSLEEPVEYLTVASQIAYHHHEKWNGRGYPRGLKGEEIPLSARIVALADVYDALRSKRVYKPSFSHEKARGIIVSERGEHFQPEVVNAFLGCEDILQSICDKFPPE